MWMSFVFAFLLISYWFHNIRFLPNHWMLQELPFVVKWVAYSLIPSIHSADHIAGHRETMFFRNSIPPNIDQKKERFCLLGCVLLLAVCLACYIGLLILYFYYLLYIYLIILLKRLFFYWFIFIDFIFVVLQCTFYALHIIKHLRLIFFSS